MTTNKPSRVVPRSLHVSLPGELPDHVAVGVVPLRAVRLVDDEQPEIAGGEKAAAQIVGDNLHVQGR